MDRNSSAEIGEEVYEFPLEEPSTLPLRGSSGRFIKGKVIAAMADQHSAMVTVNRDLDEFVQKINQCILEGVPPPPDTTQR